MKEYESSFNEMTFHNDNQTCDLILQRIGFIPALILYLLVMIMLISSSFYLSGYPVDVGILISEWGFIFVPSLIFLGLFRVRILKELKVARISTRTTAGVIIASVSGILLTGELMVLQNEIVPFPPKYLEMMRDLFTISGKISIHRAAFAFALSPAICEELLFRGILLQGSIRKVPAPWAIILTGLLFGIFHIDPYRLLGTTVLGLIMGYIAVKAGSLLASVIYHLTNNLMVLLVMNATPFREVPWLMEEAHLPLGVLILSAFTFVVSLKLIHSQSEKKVTTREPGFDCTRNISADDP